MSWFDRAISLAIPAVPKPIVYRFSKRYIAGSTTEDAFRAVRELAAVGALATLDILGESTTTLEEAERATREYEELIRRIAEPNVKDLHISVKLTALGLLQDEVHELVALATARVDEATSLYEFTRVINDHYSAAQKVQLIEAMWAVAFADGDLDKYEEHLIRQVAELIYVPHQDYVRCKRRAEQEHSQPR